MAIPCGRPRLLTSRLPSRTPLPHGTAFSEDEKAQILQSESFLAFFEKTTKIVERALHEPFDILVDYAAAVDQDRCVPKEESRQSGQVGARNEETEKELAARGKGCGVWGWEGMSGRSAARELRAWLGAGRPSPRQALSIVPRPCPSPLSLALVPRPSPAPFIRTSSLSSKLTRGAWVGGVTVTPRARSSWSTASRIRG